MANVVKHLEKHVFKHNKYSAVLIYLTLTTLLLTIEEEKECICNKQEAQRGCIHFISKKNKPGYNELYHRLAIKVLFTTISC